MSDPVLSTCGSSPDGERHGIDIYCLTCGYNLRGTSRNRCPECGTDIDRAALTSVQIPWVHRRAQGRIRTYVQTVWMVTFRTRRLCAEIDRPVSYQDSQSFRWATVAVVYLPLLLTAWSLLLTGRLGDLSLPGVIYMFQVNPLVPLLVYSLSMLAFLGYMTGLPSYFLHPSHIPIERQNRAIALSYYGGGVFAWAVPAYAWAGVLWYLTHRWQLEMSNEEYCIIAGAVPLLFVVTAWLDALQKLFERTTNRSATLWLLLMLGVCWVLGSVVAFILLPCTVLYLAVILRML